MCAFVNYEEIKLSFAAHLKNLNTTAVGIKTLLTPDFLKGTVFIVSIYKLHRTFGWGLRDRGEIKYVPQALGIPKDTTDTRQRPYKMYH